MSDYDVDDGAPDEPAGLSLSQVLAASEPEEGESDEHAEGQGPDRRWYTTGVSYQELSEEIPPQVARYLKIDETRVMATQQHPIKLLVPGFAFAGGLIIAATINGILYADHAASPTPVHALWIAYMVVALWAASRYVAWRQRWFVVTGQRLMLVSGVIGRKVDMLPITKLRDVHYQQSWLGRIVGYATFNCDSIATEHALQAIYFVPYPEEIYREICNLIMPEHGRRGPSSKPGERPAAKRR